MIQKGFTRLVLFLLSIIGLNFIVGCNSNTESDYVVVESGIYDDCQTIKSNKSIKINGQDKGTGTHSVCSNAVVNVYNPVLDKFEDKLIIFSSSFFENSKINDATTLWYNGPALVKKEGNVYVGYITSEGEVNVTKYSVDNKKRLDTVTLWHFNLGDDHSSPSLQFNHNGELVALFSYHSTEMYRAIINTELELSLSNVSVIDSGYTTYPMMYKLSNETLISFYRKGFSGDNSKGEYHYITSSDGGLTWSDSNPFIKFDSRYITYAIVDYIDDTLYVAYSSLDRNDGMHKNIYISHSNDLGKTWFSKDGYSDYLTGENSVKVVSGNQIRIHDIGLYKKNVAVSYSKYDQEYDCCSKINDLYVYLDDNGESYYIAKGLINYYSDGLVFDNDRGNVGYYISHSDDASSAINMVEFNDVDNNFNMVGQVSVDEKIMRLNSYNELGVGSLTWIEYEYYNSYNDFKTNLTISGM
ncbi:BNR-4 repeat-containing protein [Vibrio vulnificus]|nr:BNR-4 repeat-containing protein [Vibrio vulnificus]